uniref:Uncharacterized protein n=1 Tax=Arcella intermedia TaxID=1963864 RepID=A0A6B2LMG6_9EUKA
MGPGNGLLGGLSPGEWSLRGRLGLRECLWRRLGFWFLGSGLAFLLRLGLLRRFGRLGLVKRFSRLGLVKRFSRLGLLRGFGRLGFGRRLDLLWRRLGFWQLLFGRRLDSRGLERLCGASKGRVRFLL